MKQGRPAIGFVLDYSCPWCFIGYRHLDTALYSTSRTPHHFVEILPFQLHPSINPKGVPHTMFDKKAPKGTGRLIREAATEAGIDQLSWPDLLPNTLLVHRNISALNLDDQWSGAGLVFAALWEKNLSMTSQVSISKILSSKSINEVKLASIPNPLDLHATSLQINAVPSYILAKDQIHTGVITAQRWVKYLDRIDSMS